MAKFGEKVQASPSKPKEELESDELRKPEDQVQYQDNDKSQEQSENIPEQANLETEINPSEVKDDNSENKTTEEAKDLSQEVKPDLIEESLEE